MSDPNEKKPDDFSLDADSAQPENANTDFDFTAFMNDDTAAAPEADFEFGDSTDQESKPISLAKTGTEETPISLEKAESEESSISLEKAESEENSFPGFETENSQESSASSAETTPDFPSSFLSDSAEETSSELSDSTEAASVPAIDPNDKKVKKGKKDKSKKEDKPKKEKKPKETGPREPMNLGGVLSLVLGIFLLLGLIGLNVLIATAPVTPGIGASSTMYYLIGFNAFGLLVVGVPFLFWLSAKTLQLIDVQLGIALMALSIGVIFFLTALYRYDFTIKAAHPVPPSVVQRIA